VAGESNPIYSFPGENFKIERLCVERI